MTYVLYFQNIYLGLTSAFLRIIYAITFGLLLFFRLDRVVLMKGLESFDAGGCGHITMTTTILHSLLRACPRKLGIHSKHGLSISGAGLY